MREYPTTRKRKKKKKTSSGLILFELFLLAIILVVVFKGDTLYKLGKQMLKIENLNLVKVTEIPYTGRNTLTQSSVFRANENIIVCEEATLKVYSNGGELQFEGELNADATLVDGGNTFYVIAESTRGELVTVDYKGNILNRIKDIGGIKDIELFDDETILIKMQDQKSVKLYGKDLALLMTATIPTGQILEAKAFMQAKTIAIAAIETDGNALGTTIYQYSFEGKLLGITNLDAEIVYGLFADDKLHALTDTSMYTLTPDGVVIQKDTYDGLLHSFTTLKGGLVLLTESLIEDVVEDMKAYNFQTYDWKTYALKAIPLEVSYLTLLKGNQYILGLSENTIDLYDESYALKTTLANEALYTKGFWLNDHRLLLYNDTTADIFDVEQ